MIKLSMGRKTPFYPTMGSGTSCPSNSRMENGKCVPKSTTPNSGVAKQTLTLAIKKQPMTMPTPAASRKSYTPPSAPSKGGSGQSANVSTKSISYKPATKKKLVLGGMRF